MDVILRDRVAKLGDAGDMVHVKDGYARNYLIPNGLAYPATEGNKRRWEAEARGRARRQVQAKGDADVLARELAQVELRFTARTGDADKLFGSITAQDVAAALKDRGIAVDKRTIELDDPIKMIGVYQVPVRLHPEVRPEVRVIVDKE